MEVWLMLSRAHSHRSTAAVVTIPMFSMPIRALWFLLLACTLASELVPLTVAFEAQFSSLAFHSYQALKLVAFVALGFMTPLAWWRTTAWESAHSLRSSPRRSWNLDKPLSPAIA